MVSSAGTNAPVQWSQQYVTVSAPICFGCPYLLKSRTTQKMVVLIFCLALRAYSVAASIALKHSKRSSFDMPASFKLFLPRQCGRIFYVHTDCPVFHLAFISSSCKLRFASTTLCTNFVFDIFLQCDVASCLTVSRVPSALQPYQFQFLVNKNCNCNCNLIQNKP